MNEPEAKPDADYTTQQAADRCGMSINTLLAWERRYGVPSPRRNERDERIYTEADLRVIRWLRDETAQGTPIGQAVRRLPQAGESHTISDTASDDVVVALDPARSPESRRSRSSAEADAPSQATIWQRELVAALHDYDRSRFATILGNAALASSPLQTTEQVVVPAMQRIIAEVGAGEIDRVLADIADKWFSARLSHWLDTVMPSREHAESIVVVLASDQPWSSVWTLAIAVRRAAAGAHVIDLPPGCPAESIQSVVTEVGASEVIARAHNAAERRALYGRQTMLRSILPEPVTLTLLDSDSHPSPDSDAVHDTGQSFPISADPDSIRIINHGSDTSPHPDS